MFLGVAGAGLLAFVALAASVGLAQQASELPPNLEALPASEIRLETGGDGRTYVRFSTTSWNSGLAVLELLAGEVDKAQGKQKVHQRLYSDDGSFRDVLAGSFEWHQGHGHFHFEDYALYTLQPVDAPGASESFGSKTTFCILDTDRIDHKLPGAPKQAVYTSCGPQVEGLSVGWGDTYRYYLAGQAIDVTGLPAGDYKLTIEVDPKNRLIETNDDDNTSTVLLRLNLSEGTVEVLDSGGGGGPGNGNGNGNGNGRGNGRGPR